MGVFLWFLRLGAESPKYFFLLLFLIFVHIIMEDGQTGIRSGNLLYKMVRPSII